MSHSGASSPSPRPKSARPKKCRPNASRKTVIENPKQKSERRPHAGLPLPLKRLVQSFSSLNSRSTNSGSANRKSTDSRRKDAGKSRRQGKAASDYPRKVLWAGGSVATLALLAIVPAQVGSQAIATSSCQEVIKSGAEISRDELSRLLSIPQGASREAVRQVIDAPYCLLPVAQSPHPNDKQANNGEEAAKAATREAYPLAFDPQAWVVVDYDAGEYAGYDFVFKP